MTRGVRPLALALALALAACGGSDGGDVDAGAADAAADADTGPIVIAMGQSEPAGITVLASGVYFTNRAGGTLVRCPLGGCGDTDPEVLLSGLTGPIAVTADATNLYYVTGWHDGESGAPPERPVSSCPIDDCRATTAAELDRGSIQPYGLRVDSGTAYLAAWPQVASCPITGCTGSTTSLGGGPAVDLELDASYLYIAYHGFGRVERCARPDCSNPEPWIPGVYATAVAVDDTRVYATDYNFLGFGGSSPPRIVSCPLAGCDATAGPTVIASGDDISPYGLAVHGDRLYYTNLEQGTVVSIPLP